MQIASLNWEWMSITVPIGHKSSLVQVFAWCWIDNKPLSDSPTHICSTQPERVKSYFAGGAETGAVPSSQWVNITHAVINGHHVQYSRLCVITLRWRHNIPEGVSNRQRLRCLLNCWFRCRSKKTSKLLVTGLCAGNSPVTGEFPAQMASNAENVSIWWRHHESRKCSI